MTDNEGMEHMEPWAMTTNFKINVLFSGAPPMATQRGMPCNEPPPPSQVKSSQWWWESNLANLGPVFFYQCSDKTGSDSRSLPVFKNIPNILLRYYFISKYSKYSTNIQQYIAIWPSCLILVFFDHLWPLYWSRSGQNNVVFTIFRISESWRFKWYMTCPF